MSAAAPAAAHDRLSGLAHVATCSFLASRLAPSAQFWIALAGGVALARAGARHGTRAGYGASLAAVVQTVAMIGPARVNGPLTQALNAPLVGSMVGRGRPFWAVLLACLSIRLAHYVLINVLFVYLIVGGLEDFVATYDKVAGFFRVLPTGTTAAIVFTVVAALFWGCFFSVVQVLAYRRALERWPAETEPEPAAPEAPLEEIEELADPHRRTAAWPVVAVATVGIAALLTSTAWSVLGAVTAALTLAWLATRAFDWPATRLGLILAVALAFGALMPAILGAVPWEEALARAARAALLVMVATWARAAAGPDGIRKVARATLSAARLHVAAGLTAELSSDRRLGAAGRSLVDTLRPVEKDVLPVADALTTWVAAESARHG